MILKCVKGLTRWMVVNHSSGSFRKRVQLLAKGRKYVVNEVDFHRYVINQKQGVFYMTNEECEKHFNHKRLLTEAEFRQKMNDLIK